mgnify:CR=1 FL=1
MASPEILDAEHKHTLLRVARESIAHGLEAGCALPVTSAEHPPELQAQRASFVTLEAEGRLRGCIGALEARLPLVRDVAEHAYAAAFQDPRFQPVGRDELPGLSLHVSVLTPSTPFPFADEADLVARLRPGVDGLIIACGGRRATFLPSVWEQVPSPELFLAHLKHKAGITGVETDPLQAWRYETLSFGED